MASSLPKSLELAYRFRDIFEASPAWYYGQAEYPHESKVLPIADRLYAEQGKVGDYLACWREAKVRLIAQILQSECGLAS